MPRRSPIALGSNPQEHPALSGGHVVILSGEKPLFEQHVRGPQGHAALGNVLDQNGFEYEPIHGKYAGEKQPGYIVHVKNDSDVERLEGIAKRFGQESIVHSRAGQHQLVYTAGDDEGKATQPSSGVNWFGDQEPDDNYSTLYGPSGEPLGHFSYNLDFDHPLVDRGPAGVVSGPEAAGMILKSAVDAYYGVLMDLRKRELEKASKFAPGITVAAGVKVKPNVAAALQGLKPRKPEETAAPSTSKFAPGITVAAGVKVKPNVAAALQGLKPRKPEETAAPSTSKGTFTQGLPVAHSGRSQTLMDKRPTKKYEVDTRAEAKHNTRAISDDISAQGFGGPLTNPNNPVITGGPIYHNAPGTTKKSEESDRDRIEKIRRREHDDLVGIPWSDSRNKQPFTPNSGGPILSIAEQRKLGKQEKPMKLHDLLKAQVQANGGRITVKMEPLSKPPVSEAQRRAMGAAKSEESPKDPTHGTYIVKNSIFKKMPEMGKGEVKANGGTIKLGKQEYYIDLKNASDPKKRLKETNPVKESVVPGGKETGWQTDGPKPKIVERSASGGAISKNPPKAGPDQKNTAENSIVEGKAAQKAASKNAAIEKAAASMSAPKPPQAPGAGSPTLSAKPPAKPPQAAPGGAPMAKAFMPFTAQQEAAEAAYRQQVASETPPETQHRRPELRPQSDFDPSLYQPSGPVSSGLQTEAEANRPPPGTGVVPKAKVPVRGGGTPAQFQPSGPVKSGLFTHSELHQPLPGTGVTPKPAAPLKSPAQHKGIRGFLGLGKAELCKGCGKVHKAGQCV